jgi:phthiocerol/phenolphthiocerol synthesis type-I polyketide synthase A
MRSFTEADLRDRLVDYLVGVVGCHDVDCDVSLWDLGVGSRDAVVLSGELSELLERPVSPVEFWQHPTINGLARFLAGSESEPDVAIAADQDRRLADEPVAVIGLGCRFPGGVCGPEALWRFLCDGRSAVGEVPPDRWAGFGDGSPEVAAALSGVTRWGSFLSEVDAFDAEFFEISPREAAKMDPQQRLLLEVTQEALEHAGIPAESLRQTLTGVFAGACAGEYGYLAAADLSQVDAWSGTGGALSIIANRVSYFFDLHGPSVTIDTACSSSLVAVHLACQSLRMGDSNLAIAAGVNLLLSPAITRSFDQAQAMSPTGRCRSFDAGANGFVRGEGCGAVVLKRLSDAVADGDRVLAVVCGSAVNQDGRSNGLMAPNPAAQMAVLRAAYANAGIEPRHVDYVEAHGTGTLLGDPIEARALGGVLGRARPQSAPLLIGAVKSNLGHLEAAAGIAGFIKAVLSVQRGHIPANLHFESPNPHIPFEDLRLKVVAGPTDWPSTGQPRRAGVSSFGFGGTNAHVVLEQAPEPGLSICQPYPAVTTLVVSAKTDHGVASTAGMLAQWMQGAGAGVALADVAHTVNHHRSRHAKFATVVAVDHEQAVAGLRALAAGYSMPGVVGPHQGPCRAGTVFVYSGQGSQWAGMGRQLLADEPEFATAVARLEPTFVEQVGFSLLQVLAGGESVVGIDRIQPVLVGVQLALTELWQSYGVQPDAVIGHSMGEVSAAVVAGALTAAEGLRVIATRSRLMSKLSGQGAMALLELDAAGVEALIGDYPQVTLAVYASPRQSVIAGPPEQVDAVVAVVDAQDRLARRIEVDVASHHPIIDVVLPQLKSALSDLTPRSPMIPVISTTGVEPVFDADYWAVNLRNPVQFSQAVATASIDHATFVEVSPHPLLTYAISDTLTQTHHHSIATLTRDTHDTFTFHTNLNTAHTTRPPNTDHPPEPHPHLPTTPWQHTRHWITRRERVGAAGFAPVYGTLLGEHVGVATTPPVHVWQARLLPQAKPYPGFHRVRGMEVVPVSVLLQTLSTAATECEATALSEIRFHYPIIVDQDRLIQVVADGENIAISSAATTDAAPHHWVTHATARLSLSPPSPRVAAAGTGATAQYHEDINGNVNGDETRSIVDLLAGWDIEGQSFPWSIGAVKHTPGRVVAEISVTEASTVALLDVAIHLARLVDAADPRLMVPARVESMLLSTDLADRQSRVEIRQQPGAADEIVVDIAVTAFDGTTYADVRSLRYAAVEFTAAHAPVGGADPRSFAHAIEWRPWPQGAHTRSPLSPIAGERTLAVIGASDGACDDLRSRLTAAGYLPARVTEARYVVYLAEPQLEKTDIDNAVRLSTEVGELVRLLADRDDQHPAALWILTRGVREADSVQALSQSCLWGMARVIAAEQPDVWGGLLDVSDGDDFGDCVPVWCSLLPTAAEPILVLRDGELLAPVLTPVSGQPMRKPLRCRPDAGYLITGGLGALGLMMADWLADRGARRLVLAGRTALPPRRDWDSAGDPEARRKIAAIRALELRGVAVDIETFDVGAAEAVQALLARRDSAGAPPIRGVIHAAGVAEGKLLTELADNTFHQVMWPKIAGGQALHVAFQPGELDFFFLIASAGTAFGIPGQGAYAAANAYLDCLARARHRRGCHTVSLDWVPWQGLGFASDAAVVVSELERLGSRPLTPEEAFAAWEHVDTYDIAQALMAPLTSSDHTVAAAPHTVSPAQTWSQLTADELARELEAELRTILAGELRLSKTELELDRPFAELGLDSVMAMSIRRTAEQLVGIELSATMLWNHPTIASLTAYLTKKILAQQDSDNECEVLSDPENRALEALFDQTESGLTQVASLDESATLIWSEMSAESILGELEVRLRAILAHELGMPASVVDVHRPFPELGLDSMMAMAVLREAKQLVGLDLSATMLWNHPTISSLAGYLANALAPLESSLDSSDDAVADVTTDPERSVLDELFDSVESATAGSEGGIW